MAIKISGTTIINDSRAILDHTSNVGTAGSMLVSTGAGICWKSAPSAGFSADSQQNLYAGYGAGSDSDADTCWNIGIGYSAGHRNVAGDKNVFLGWCPGANVPQGGCNVFLGAYAGEGSTGQTTGPIENIAIGLAAGRCLGDNTNFNILMGSWAGTNMVSAYRNIIMGHFAGSCCAITGDRNIFLGEYSGRCATSGGYNIAFGKNSLGNGIMTGEGNLAMGCGSGKKITSGANNLLLGKAVGDQLTGASCNLFIGNFAGCSSTAGDHNVIIGNCANVVSATGSTQLAVGIGATNWIRGDSSFNIFDKDGNQLNGAAGFSADSQENLYAGTGAGTDSDADTCFNVAIGYSAGHSNCAGDKNVIRTSC